MMHDLPSLPKKDEILPILDTIKQKAIHWLIEHQTKDGPFGSFICCKHAFSPGELDASTAGIELWVMLDLPMNDSQRKEAVNYIQSYQNPHTGLVIDHSWENRFNNNPDRLTSGDTFFTATAIEALSALKSGFIYPIKYLEDVSTNELLSKIDLSISALHPFSIGDLGSLLINNIKCNSKTASEKWLAINELLQQKQNNQTGLWLDSKKSQPLAPAVNRTFHFLRSTWNYSNHPYINASEMIDSCLLVSRDKNYYGWEHGDACNELDLAFVIYSASIWTKHREEDIRNWAIDTLPSILFLQKDDGGFSYKHQKAMFQHNNIFISPGFPEGDIWGLLMYLGTIKMMAELAYPGILAPWKFSHLHRVPNIKDNDASKGNMNSLKNLFHIQNNKNTIHKTILSTIRNFEKPKVVMTLLIRDEVDIIQYWLDFHLANGIDQVLALDNASQDGTTEILKEYEKTGRVVYIYEPSNDYQQDKWVTWLARKACTEFQADWVINADADEFYIPKNGNLKQLLKSVPKNIDVISIKRNDMLPLDGIDLNKSPEVMVYHHKESLEWVLKHPIVDKLIHRGYDEIEISRGCHNVYSKRSLKMAPCEDIFTLHFPIRSYTQFFKKVNNVGRGRKKNNLPESRYAAWLASLENGTLQETYDKFLIKQSEIPMMRESGQIIEEKRLSNFFRKRDVKVLSSSLEIYAERLRTRLVKADVSTEALIAAFEDENNPVSSQEIELIKLNINQAKEDGNLILADTLEKLVEIATQNQTIEAPKSIEQNDIILMQTQHQSLEDFEKTQSPQKLVIILGMHRSGTSLITNILAEAGYFLGESDDLMAGDTWNRDGYFERHSVVQTNDIILSMCGGNWKEPPDHRLIEALEVDSWINTILKPYENKSYSVLKDPRLCLTFPVWKRVFSGNVRVIYITRNFEAVAKSLLKRDKFSHDQSRQLWQTYNERALKYISSLPVFSIEYETLLSDKRKDILDALSNFLEIDIDLESIANKVVDDSLDHSKKDHVDLAQLFVPTEYGYTEEFSQVQDIQENRWNCLVFPFEYDARLSQIPLRFDPYNGVGIFKISSIVIKSRVDESILWNSNTPEAFDLFELRGTSIRQPHDQLFQIYSYGSDPQIYFPVLPKNIFDTPVKLEIWLQITTVIKEIDQEDVQIVKEKAGKIDQIFEEFKKQRSLLELKEKQIAWLQSVAKSWGRYVATQRTEKNTQLMRLGRILELQVQRTTGIVDSTSRLLESALGEDSAKELFPLARILETMPSLESIKPLFDVYNQDMQNMLKACSANFDSEYYLEQYPDVTKSGLSPLQHYLQIGCKEFRFPNPLFDPKYYLDKYSDVQESGIDPFHHYSEIGFQEGRIPHPKLENLIGSEESTEESDEPWKFVGNSEMINDKTKRINTIYFKNKINEVYDKSPDFIPRREIDHSRDANEVKLIAFYFPQFHPFPENEEFWGKGFTEWTSVTKAVPLFEGHQQPRLPSELGFYDLRIKEIIQEQIEIAKQYGIYGFCFHHYWFTGRRVMRVPYNHILANSDLEIPFCLHWANEPWTVRWDGFTKSGVLLDQKHTPEDDMAFIQDITPALRDPRYIRINDRPLLIIYRPGLFPDIQATIDRWRNYCAKQGIGDLYLSVMQTGFEGQINPAKYGFDAAIEYPPHNMDVTDIKSQVKLFDNDFSGHIYSYPEMVSKNINRKKPPYKLFRGVVPDWDCTPRRKNADIMIGSTPANYQRWLHGQIQYTRENLSPEERFIFINAWNEWAEGAYLEPDRKYGYAYLNATANSLNKRKLSKIAIVAHLFHDDLAEEFIHYFENIPLAFDLYISTHKDAKEKLKRIFSKHFGEHCVHVRAVENVGRDMAPFVLEFGDIYDQYDLVCWVHSKKSEYDPKLSKWRHYLLDNLLGNTDSIETIISYFEQDPQLGLVFPEYFPPISHMVEWGSNFETTSRLCKKLGIHIEQSKEIQFPAGSMFWFRPDALQPIYKKLSLTLADFEPPAGEIDGSLAHAIERMFLIVTDHQKYSWRKVIFSPYQKDQINFQAPRSFNLNLILDQPQKIAAVIHLFYPDLSKEIIGYLKNIPIPFDIFLSTTKDAKDTLLQEFSDVFGEQHVTVKAVENIGFDIAPLLVDFNHVYKEYDLICKIHGKKSLHNPGHNDWREYLLQNLLGSQEQVKTIISYMINDPTLGLILPETYPGVLAYNQEDPWRNNWSICREFGKRLDLKLERDMKLDFPSGSMFWFKPAALDQLFSLGLTRQDFGNGEIKLDGTLAHAIERLFLLIVQNQQYKYQKVLFTNKA